MVSDNAHKQLIEAYKKINNRLKNDADNKKLLVAGHRRNSASRAFCPE